MIIRLVYCILSFIAVDCTAQVTPVTVSLNYSNTFTQRSGIHRKKIERVFQLMPQYQLVWRKPMNIKRSIVEFKSARLNGILNSSAVDKVSGCLTEPIFFYLNVFVLYRQHGFRLEGLEDLANKTVVAFNRSTKIIGLNYAQAITASAKFTELNDQLRLAKYLIGAVADIAVADIDVFLSSLQQYNKKLSAARRIAVRDFDFYHIENLSKRNGSRITFDSPTLCKAFNSALSKLEVDDGLPTSIAEHDIKLILLKE